MPDINITDLTSLIRGLIKDLVKTDGHESFVYSGDASFPIGEDFPVTSSIIVHVNGSEIDDDDFVYDADLNEVTVELDASGEALTADDIIEIYYDYTDKYSDTEIKGYIKSALLNFVMHRYAKVFETDDDGNVVTEDSGETLTTQDKYVIALVTAVSIDPDNITIKTPDFTREGTEKRSKSELIADIIKRSDRYLGSVEFLEDDEDIS